MSGFFKQTKQGASTGSTLTPNVGQYGWTLYESQSVSQIIGFVNEAKGYAVEAATSANNARGSAELALTYVNLAKDWAGKSEVSYNASKEEADRAERYASQTVDIYNTFLNVAANQRIIETFDLAVDQTVVTFTKIMADAAFVSVNGQRIDSCYLIKDIDYTITGVSKITLKRRYPVGTKLSAVQDIKKDESVPGVSESAAIWNRQFRNALVGVIFGDYNDHGRDVTPRLVFEGGQYLPTYDSSEAVTFTDIPVKQNNGDIIINTNKGQRRFSRNEAEAVPRQDFTKITDELIESVANRKIHSKKVAWKLPLNFPHYETCRAIADNAQYIYPQGIAMDSDKIYTLWSAVPSVDKVFIVVFSKTGTYLGYHYLGIRAIGEGLHINGSTAVVADREGNLATFTLKDYGNERLIPTSKRAVGVYNQFFFGDGKIYIDSVTPEIGQVNQRTVISVLNDKTYALEGFFTVPLQYSGYITTGTNPLAPYFPKRQGFVMKGGYFHSLMGGIWMEGNDTPPYTYQGIHILKSSGEAVFSSILHPDKMVATLKREGISATRIENEGACVHDNKVYSLAITNNVRDAVAVTEGMVIFEEMSIHKDAIAFDDCEALFTPFDTERFSIGTMPRVGSSIYNPVTGAAFTSMSGIRDYMYDSGQKVFSFYTSSVGEILDLNGVKYPSSTYVTMTSLNNNTFMVETSSTTNGQTKRDFWYPKDSADWSKGFNIRPVTEDVRATDVLLQSVYSATGRQLGRVLGAAYGSVTDPVTNGNKVLGIDIQSANGSQPMFIGGGSSLYRSADSIHFVTNPTTTDLGGTVRWVIGSNGSLYPYADNTYTVGTSSRRAANMYSTLGVQTTSDARLKKPTIAMTDAELKAAGEIAESIGFWEWSEGGDRRHCGTTVQLAIEILESYGLDPFSYSFICYDEWEEQKAEYTDEGCEVSPYRAAGSVYSFRDSELNKFLIRGLHERIKRIEQSL